MIPPDGGREDGELAEGVSIFESEKKGDEAAERRAAHAGGCGVFAGAVGAVDEGEQFAHEQLAVGFGFASAHLPVGSVGILGHAAGSGVVQADDEERLHSSGEDFSISMLVHAPGAAGDEGRFGVEKILPVVEVEDGVAPVGVLVVSRRQVDEDVAIVGQEMAVPLAMDLQLRERSVVGDRRGAVAIDREVSLQIARLGFRWNPAASGVPPSPSNTVVEVLLIQ